MNIKIVKKLLENKANVNAQDQRGNTALHHMFANFDHKKEDINTLTKITKILIDNGANLNIKNEKGDIAIDFATANNLSEDIINLLKNAGSQEAVEPGQIMRNLFQE